MYRRNLSTRRNDGLTTYQDDDPGGDFTADDDNDRIPASGCLGGTDPSDDGPSWDTNCDGIRDGLSASYCNGLSTSVDSDGDHLKQRWEVCKWGTSDSDQDSDDDGLK